MLNQPASVFHFLTMLPGVAFVLKCLDLTTGDVAVYSGCKGEDKAVVKTAQASTQVMWYVVRHRRFLFGLQLSSWFLVELLGGVDDCC